MGRMKDIWEDLRAKEEEEEEGVPFDSEKELFGWLLLPSSQSQEEEEEEGEKNG